MALSSAEAELGAAVKAGQEVLGIMSLWKDVGEATRRHVMGDARAAIGIIRRMGFSEGETPEYELWVQEKEASRELQYNRVSDSDKGADLFTNAFAHDSVMRHTEAMGCVNNLCANVSLEK